MRNFDYDFVEEAMQRLGEIEPGAPPVWGTLSSEGVVQHLADTVRYAMGKGPELPDKSTWFLRTIAAPLVLNGIVRIPKNVKAPPFGDIEATDDLETLHAVLDEYLALAQTGDLETMPDPLLGDIGLDGWSKMHVIHFEHHMRQFRV